MTEPEQPNLFDDTVDTYPEPDPPAWFYDPAADPDVIEWQKFHGKHRRGGASEQHMDPRDCLLLDFGRLCDR